MFRIEALAERHDLAAFRSGNEALDRWLHDHSRTAAAQGTRTYLLLDEPGSVAGYFAIAPHLVRRDDLPRRIGRGAPREIPSILLAKLALSESLQGHGLGAELLVRTLQKIIEVARTAGGKLVVVDAIDADAADFYRHHHFQSLPNREDRLIMKISTAARAVGSDWP